MKMFKNVPAIQKVNYIQLISTSQHRFKGETQFEVPLKSFESEGVWVK